MQQLLVIELEFVDPLAVVLLDFDPNQRPFPGLGSFPVVKSIPL